jgi:nicotinamidase-related amidase
MRLQVPSSTRRKALLIIDVQPATLSAKVSPLIKSMRSYIAAIDYDAYVLAAYSAGEDSMLFKQNKFSISKESAGDVDPELVRDVQLMSKPTIMIEKNVRSCFKGYEKNALLNFLHQNQIQEVHLIGYDINDCVLASAYDAIDLNFFTYVIEELCHHWDGIEELKEAALKVLRRQSLTNNSCREDLKFIIFKDNSED